MNWPSGWGVENEEIERIRQTRTKGETKTKCFVNRDSAVSRRQSADC